MHIAHPILSVDFHYDSFYIHLNCALIVPMSSVLDHSKYVAFYMVPLVFHMLIFFLFFLSHNLLLLPHGIWHVISHLNDVILVIHCVSISVCLWYTFSPPRFRGICIDFHLFLMMIDLLYTMLIILNKLGQFEVRVY